MALYRTIAVSFWTDSKVVDDFTPEDRYFYLYLFSNPHTNLAGCYEISIKQIANEMGYGYDSVLNLIKRFAEFHKVISYCKETKEILLLNWHKHNWTKSEKYQKALMKEIAKVKNDEYRTYLEGVLTGDMVSIPYAYPMDTTNTYTNTNSSSIASSNTKKPVKHKHGEYMNVLLTDVEYGKLQELFPDLDERIETLSGYIASTGKVYKNHYATIRNWARREKGKTEVEKNAQMFKNFINGGGYDEGGVQPFGDGD